MAAPKPRSSGHYVTSTVAGEAVQAFVPDPLPPALDASALERLAPPLREAEAALDRLELAGSMIPSVEWFIYAFVRKEALLSSEIEGTQATLVDVLAFEGAGRAADADPDDVEEVTNYVAALRHAFDVLHDPAGAPLSVRLLNESHELLMRGVRGASRQPGAMRRSQNWVGGTRPGNALFVPPPPGQAVESMSDLERYIHASDALHPLLRAGLVHVQFETIHPYLDGNGRLGRMLIALLLEHWGLLSRPLLYLSLYLKQHQAEYYRRLDAVRTEADWEGWLRFFLQGVAEIAVSAAATAQQLHTRVLADRARLLEHPGITVSALRLFELLPRHPVLGMPLVTRLLETTKPTAIKSIELLEQADVLMEVGQRRRDRLYRYAAYLDLLA